jgi:PAS domain S-box-containing protein
MISGTARVSPSWISVGAWIAATILSSLLIVAAVVALHVANQTALREATDGVSDLREARLNLIRGAVDLRISMLSPDIGRREQAITRLREAKRDFDAIHAADTADAQALDIEFANFIGAINRTLTDGDDPRALTAMRAAYQALDDRLVRIDAAKLRAVDELAADQDRIFEIVITVAILLIGATSVATVWSVRQRQLAIVSLRDSDERFRRLFDLSPLPKALLDEQGNVIALNRTFTTIFGYAREEIPTLDEWRRRAYPPEADREKIRARMAAHMDEARRNGFAEPEEITIVSKDGTRREMLLSAMPLEGGILASFTDITERKRAEKALHDEIARSDAARRTLAAALSAMPDPVAIIDTEGRFIHINKAYANAQGFTRIEDCPESLAGLAAGREMYSQDGRKLTPEERPFRRALRGETCLDIKYRVSPGRGRPDWYASINAAPIRDASGAIVGAVMIARDHTREHSAELALRAEMRKSDAARVDAQNVRAQLEAALGAMSESICIADPGGRFVHFNNAFLRFHRIDERLACPPRQSEFVTLVEVLDEDGNPLPPERRPLGRALAGETASGIEHRVRRVDTGRTWIGDYNIAPIRDRDDAIVGAVVSARDVTQRKADEAKLLESQSQLAQAQKMEAVGQLTGGIAHDFNNLLAVIIGNLDLLRAGETEDAAEMLDTAIHAANRGAELTRRLLAFSRRQTLQPRHVDPNALVDGLTTLLKRTLGANIAVDIRLSPDVGGVIADPAQLESALLNLAVNARDAMQGGGRLTVATRRVELDADYASLRADVTPGIYEAISVTDTGVGMPPDVAARAFEPFFTTKGIGKGSGLGLSMVYGFAKQSGGHATIYSEPGRGTTVTIYLPRHRIDLRAASGAPPSEMPARGAGQSILVVDDNPDICKLVATQLRSLGYGVEIAGDSAHAMARLEQGPAPALLLTDIMMPGAMDGTAIAAAARKLYPAMPVVYMSGYAEGGESRDRIVADGHAFLQKPFTKAQLAEAVAGAIEARGDGP